MASFHYEMFSSSSTFLLKVWCIFLTGTINTWVLFQIFHTCPACINSDIRLVDGSSSNEGRVELCYQEVWGTVCDAKWDRNNTLVACRQLGLPLDSK